MQTSRFIRPLYYAKVSSGNRTQETKTDQLTTLMQGGVKYVKAEKTILRGISLFMPA